jgi:NADH-quinone oxidoreductase subunit M
VILTIFFGVYPAPVFDATAASVDLLVNNYAAALQAAQDVALSVQ